MVTRLYPWLVWVLRRNASHRLSFTILAFLLWCGMRILKWFSKGRIQEKELMKEEKPNRILGIVMLLLKQETWVQSLTQIYICLSKREGSLSSSSHPYLKPPGGTKNSYKWDSRQVLHCSVNHHAIYKEMLFNNNKKKGSVWRKKWGGHYFTLLWKGSFQDSSQLIFPAEWDGSSDLIRCGE